jgi:hypothetical protein
MAESASRGRVWPVPAAAALVRRLEPPAGAVRMVLDTDTYNEIDDQFAVTYGLLSPERLSVEALYAAPFHNDRSEGPEDGMLRSYDELGRVVDRLGGSDVPILRGSRQWLTDGATPVPSDAADDLVRRAGMGEEPLYVVAIGAAARAGYCRADRRGVARRPADDVAHRRRVQPHG